MTTDRQRQIAKRLALPTYLRELSEIMGREVGPGELQELPVMMSFLSNAETEKNFEYRLDQFDSKLSSRLFSRLKFLNSEPVLIWLSKTKTCHAILEANIVDIHFESLVRLLPEQTIALTTRDKKDRLVLDLFEDDGSSFLEIFLSGENWAQVAELDFLG